MPEVCFLFSHWPGLVAHWKLKRRCELRRQLLHTVAVFLYNHVRTVFHDTAAPPVPRSDVVLIQSNNVSGFDF
jgi:hypothetical protein